MFLFLSLVLGAKAADPTADELYALAKTTCSTVTTPIQVAAVMSVQDYAAAKSAEALLKLAMKMDDAYVKSLIASIPMATTAEIFEIEMAVGEAQLVFSSQAMVFAQEAIDLEAEIEEYRKMRSAELPPDVAVIDCMARYIKAKTYVPQMKLVIVQNLAKIKDVTLKAQMAHGVTTPTVPTVETSEMKIDMNKPILIAPAPTSPGPVSSPPPSPAPAPRVGPVP